MMNKKLIALFVAVATVSVVSAGWYDEDGNYHHGVRSRHVVGDTTRGAGHAAKRTVEGAEDVTFGVLGAPFGGRNVEERMEDREDRREERREARRNRYNRE
jgi:hypothetical protein